MTDRLRSIGRSLGQLPGGRRTKFAVLEIGDRVWWPSSLAQIAGRHSREREQGAEPRPRVAAETE